MNVAGDVAQSVSPNSPVTTGASAAIGAITSSQHCVLWQRCPP